MVTLKLIAAFEHPFSAIAQPPADVRFAGHKMKALRGDIQVWRAGQMAALQKLQDDTATLDTALQDRLHEDVWTVCHKLRRFLRRVGHDAGQPVH